MNIPFAGLNKCGRRAGQNISTGTRLGDGVGEADDVVDGVGFPPGGGVEADDAEAIGPVLRRSPQGRREGQTARGLFAAMAEQAFDGGAKDGEVGDALAAFGRGKFGLDWCRECV
jgi:hypothetical protein